MDDVPNTSRTEAFDVVVVGGGSAGVGAAVGAARTGAHAARRAVRLPGRGRHYAERAELLWPLHHLGWGRGEPISTAFVEGAVNEVVAKRMNKQQRMR